MSSSELLARGSSALGLALGREQIARLAFYLAELAKWNRKMNLVAKAPAEEIIDSHFLDSLTLLPHLPPEKQELLDVGTGAGFPGLVLKAVCPPLALTLIEPRAKRTAFLRHIVRSLGLDRVEIIEKRLEPALAGQLPASPCITSRAVADIREFLALVAPFSPAGGTVICMKGPRAEEEIGEWQRSQPASPFRLEKVVRLTLPFSGAARNLVFFTRGFNLGHPDPGRN
jgi:16S rRNA (guanine527-N7)-methyltransferase